MKKLFFGLACIIGMMFFASCTEEALDNLLSQKPTIEFVADNGYISSNSSFYVGTELNFEVKIAPNSSTGSELAHLDFSIADMGGQTVYNENPDIEEPTGENVFTFSYVSETPSTYVVTATITDQAGKANVISVVVDYVEPVVAEMGIYEGLLTINAHLTSNEVLSQTYDDDVTYDDLPVSLALGAINEDGGIRATLEIEGVPASLYGVMEDNVITFDRFTFYKSINLIVDITIDLEMDLVATLNGNEMALEGTASGSGKTTVILSTFKVDMTGDIVGNLELIE